MTKENYLVGLMTVKTAFIIVMGILLFGTALPRSNRAIHTNCADVRQLARIQHAQVERTTRQTQGLLRAGITFGLPRSTLNRLVAQTFATQAEFLRELDRLASQSCKQ